MKRLWRWFLAYFRIDLDVVCEESKGDKDYHDYPDSIDGYPDHMVDLQCKRCGKAFRI